MSIICSDVACMNVLKFHIQQKIFLQFNKGMPYIFACHLPAINIGCDENDLIWFLTTAGISDIHFQEFKRNDTRVVATNTQLKPMGFSSGMQIKILSQTLSLAKPKGPTFYGDDLLKTEKKICIFINRRSLWSLD